MAVYGIFDGTRSSKLEVYGMVAQKGVTGKLLPSETHSF